METMKLIRLYVPIERAANGERVVEGHCYRNAAPGDGFDLPRDVMERMTADYLRYANVREMHQPSAVGVSEVTWDESGAFMRAKIVDDDAWKKVEEGVYKGFSVGIKPTKIKRVGGLNQVVDGVWYETSLVDRPMDPDSVFSIARAEGAPSPDTDEVEVEVVEDEPVAESVSRGEFEAATSTITRLEGALSEKDEEIQRFMGIVNEKETEIQRMESELATKDAEIKRLMATPDPTQDKPFKVTSARLLERIHTSKKESDEAQEEAKKEMDEIMRKDWSTATEVEREAAYTRIEELKRVV